MISEKFLASDLGSSPKSSSSFSFKGSSKSKLLQSFGCIVIWEVFLQFCPSDALGIRLDVSKSIDS